MKSLSLIVVLVALIPSSSSYTYSRVYNDGGSNAKYGSSYTSSSSSSSSSASSSSASYGYGSCCSLNRWAIEHLVDLREFANNLLQKYNSISGSNLGYSHTSWSESIINLTGKTPRELDNICRIQAEKLIRDRQTGLVSADIIAQPQFFEWKSSDILQNYIISGEDYGQQHALNLDMSDLDNVKTYTYPTEVKVVDGKTIVVHQNITEGRKRGGDGTYENPYVTVVKRNRTVVTTNAVPGYSGSYNTNFGYNTAGGGNTVVSRKKTIHDWVNQNMEPVVVDYKPVVNVDSNWGSSLNLYKPPVHIPVDTSETMGSSSNIYQTNYRPVSTVVTGSESHKKWVNGKLVYESERPIVESSSLPRDEEWKREEREHFVWFLNSGNITPQHLENWQRQQEKRLVTLAQRYQCDLEEIQKWHHDELERYRQLFDQHTTQTNDETVWSKIEHSPLYWLIQQNRFSVDELERWQRENSDKLAIAARQYQINVDDLRKWQVEELNRLRLRTSQQEDLDVFIRQHNDTMAQVQNSIKMKQQQLREMTQTFHNNVDEIKKWFSGKASELGKIITEQGSKITRITEWQKTISERLENIFKNHHGSVVNIDEQIAKDRKYLKDMAEANNVNIKDMENWQRQELERLQKEGQLQIELGIKEWQQRAHENLKQQIAQSDLTLEEFKTQILHNRESLQRMAETYKVQVRDIQEWLGKEIRELKNEGFLTEVKTELAEWQQRERQHLLSIVQQNQASVQDLELIMNNNRKYLNELSVNYNVKVSEIKQWLEKEILRLQAQGLVHVEELKEWQKVERDQILVLLQNNQLTVNELEHRLLSDRKTLDELCKKYNVEVYEIRNWIKEEAKHLSDLGLLQIQEQLQNWQKEERNYIMGLVQEHNISLNELKNKIKYDQTHVNEISQRYQVDIEVVKEWMEKEIQKLQTEGLLELEKLRDWQIDWRNSLIKLIKEREFTVEELHKWLLNDRTTWQALAAQHQIKIEEMEQWIKKEEQKFVTMGLLKPNEKLTDWQEIERRYLEQITQQQYQSVEQLKEKLRQDRKQLEELARQYDVDVEYMASWMAKELSRIRDEGQLHIENLTAWQIALSERLDELLKQNNAWSVEELDKVLRQDTKYIETVAFQYHTSVEDIDKWLQSQILHLQQQGKLNIERLTQWQREQKQRILTILEQQSSITLEEFESKVQKDKYFLEDLARKYHVDVRIVENFIQEVIKDLKEKGKFELEKLKEFRLAERAYIVNLIEQHKREWNNEQFVEQLKRNTAHLKELADKYHLDIKIIEEWMVTEFLNLRKETDEQIAKLSTWQALELERLKQVIKENNRLNYVQYELMLKTQTNHLQQLSRQYSVSVEEIKQWLREQMLNLKTTGKVQVESLAKWQADQLKQMVAWSLQQQRNVSREEFEQYLIRNRNVIKQLSIDYNVSVQHIERWMKDELQRLRNSGLIQVEQLYNWQKIERTRLENWLKQQHKAATTSEINTFITSNHDRLQKIVKDYNVSLKEIVNWIEEEGTRLELLDLVKSSNNSDWEFHESWTTTKPDSRAYQEWQNELKEYIYQTISKNPYRTQEQWEEIILKDQNTINKICDQNHIYITEVEVWIKNEIKNLANFGIIKGPNAGVVYNGWKELERQRLRAIAAEISITEEEFLEFIAQDDQFEKELTRLYGCSLRELAPFQKVQIATMRREGLLDRTALLRVEQWQKVERDRLYSFIRDKSFSLESLRNWQKQEALFNNLAISVGITAQQLRDWQIQEFQRIQNLALYYQMNLNQLQDFRDKELRFITYVMHKQTATEKERIHWGASEITRYTVLQRKTGLEEEQLILWRRKLYLLCQARLPFTYDNNGGKVDGPGGTGTTTVPKQEISKDRGDQPPNIYEESIDNNEPEVAGYQPVSGYYNEYNEQNQIQADGNPAVLNDDYGQQVQEQ